MYPTLHNYYIVKIYVLMMICVMTVVSMSKLQTKIHVPKYKWWGGDKKYHKGLFLVILQDLHALQLTENYRMFKDNV